MISRFRQRVGERFRQIRVAFAQTRAADDRLVLYMSLAAALGVLVPFGVLAALGSPVLGLIAGVVSAPASALAVLGIRGQNAAIAQIEGQPGAAAAVLQQLRGAWRLTPAVAFSGKQDLIHRVVGRPGVILVGEGRRARVKALLRQEVRKTSRIAGDIPVHEVSVGRGEGQVELARLRMHVMRLPRAMKAKEIGPLDRRLHALGGADLPIPKGPLRGSRRMR